MPLGTPWTPPTPSYLSTASVDNPGDGPTRPVVTSSRAAAYTGPDGACLAASVPFSGFALVRRITVQATAGRCTARVYVGTPSAETLVCATRSGDLDENDTGSNPIPVGEGQTLWVLWATTTGTATVRVEAEVH